MGVDCFSTRKKDLNDITIKYDIHLVNFDYIDKTKGRINLDGVFRFNYDELCAELDLTNGKKLKYHKSRMQNFKIIKNNII